MSKGDKNDKSLARKIKSHVESCHKHTFAVSIIDGQVFLMGEQGVLSFMEAEAKHVTIHELLKKLAEDHGTKSGDGEEDAQLKYSEVIFPVFPKLSVPFKSRKWAFDVARAHLLRIFHILGFGHGSVKKYGRETDEPAGWPQHHSWEEFGKKGGPNHASIRLANDVIESILSHHGYDAHTHHVEEPLATEDNDVEEEVHDQPEVHGGEALDNMDDMDPDHDHLNVVAGECDLCDYFKLRDKTVAERRAILIANDFM